MNILRFSAAPAFATALASCLPAADRWWDGGTTDIATNGDGASGSSTGLAVAGTWNATLKNWDQGSGLAHVTWDNSASPPDTAIFGGTHSNTIKTVTIGSNITANQIRIVSGSTGNFRYDIGASATQNDAAIAFGGTSYGTTMPQIDAAGAGNTNFNAKITGNYTISGGLFITHGSNITTPGTSGRLNLTNQNNDFTGDITLLSGNLAGASAGWGNAANKLLLRGGAIFVSGGAAVTTTNNRNIEVATASGIATNAATAGLQILDLTGSISGAANLTRYSSVAGSATSELRLSGDMSGFTGLIENTGGTATNNLMTIQTTATSGGTWKLTGGKLKLNASNNDAITHGPGKSDLLMNGGTLDLNGKAETINGLNGPTGTVQNQLAASAATLTVGAGDATATFGGTIRDNPGTGGTVALTKTGAGTQVLTGAAVSHTGPTAVDAGALVVSSNSATLACNVTVADAATFGVKALAPGAGITLPSLATGSGAGSTVLFDMGDFVPPATAALTAATFTPGLGAVTKLRLKGYNFTTGPLTLVKYTTLGGAGFAGLDRQLPYRVAGTLVDNTTNSSVDLNITSAEHAVWNGNVNGDWDVDPDAAGTAGTLNWKTSVGNVATRYAQGPDNTDQVTFNDAAAGTTTVNLTTTLTPSHVLVDNSGAKTYTFSGSGKLSGETALVKDNTGRLVVATTAPFDHSGGTTVRLGTLQLGDGATVGAGRITGTITAENTGTVAFHHPEDVTVTNLLTGGGELRKAGPNTLTLDGANTCSGAIVVSKGTLAAATNGAFGTAAVSLGDADTGADPVTLLLDRRVDVANAVYVEAAGIGTATLAASNTAPASGSGANPASFTGTVTLDRAATFRNDIAGDRLAFDGRITGTPGTLTITGGNRVSFSSTFNDFTGNLAISGAGTALQASNTSAAEVIPDTAVVDVGAGAFLKLAATANLTETIAGLTGTGTVQRLETNTGLQTLAVGAGDTSSTFDGTIVNGVDGTNVIALTKVGAGTLTLNGANSYTGSTTVSAGTLLVNGSINSLGMVTNATLGGTGTVKNVFVYGTGRISPATTATIGTLTTTGNVTFEAGTELVAQLNSNGSPACDRLAVTGDLALANATLAVTDLGSTTLTGYTRLVLATATGAISGTFNGLPNNSNVALGPNTFKLRYDDTEGGKAAVTLTLGTPSGYAGWALTNGVGAADADHENDDVENGIEYVLGTDPKAASTSGIKPAATATEFKFTFTRSDASETPDTAVVIEVSNDLVNWAADASPFTVGATTGTSSPGVTVIENPAAPNPDPGTDTVTLTLPRNTSAKFARLRVTVTQ